MLNKIFSVDQIRKADQYTIENEPISSVELMERAANECVIWLKQKAQIHQRFSIFAGPGNNGGDGLVIARLLKLAGHSVEVFIMNVSGKYSPDFQVNHQRIQEIEGIESVEWNNYPQSLPEISPDSIIIDAIFGSGLTKSLSGFPQKVIGFLNELPNVKVAIDIPSGLFADQALGSDKETVVHADYTLSFQFPKLAFLFPENEKYVGRWQVLDIGLSADYIENTKTYNYYLNHGFMASLLKPRSKFSHKGSFGHLLLIAGDHTKMGAAVLSSKAAIRSGAGLVTLHHPKSSASSFLAAAPEIMSSLDASDDAFTSLPDLNKYSNIAIGPGIGTRKQTANALKFLIQEVQTPMVFDADALNILSENKTWLNFVPKHSIFTPHIKEFERLVGKFSNHFSLLEKAKEFAKKYQIYLIIKGAHSMIITPTEHLYFNSTGNPGMATGGSGDVLTGVLAGLLAQSYSPLEASMLAVYLHGLAGDMAAEELGFESMISGDIIHYLAKAFKSLY